MKLIDKDKIDEILRNLWKKDDGHNPEHRICYNKALQEVQCEIDALEVKEVDLEKEIKEQTDIYYNMCEEKLKEMSDDDTDLSFLTLDSYAKHFFELGLNTQKGE